jgi:hypothetical protein
MKNFNLLLKELLGDVRALGSWVFFLLFVVRVMILPNQWPLLNQLLIAGFLILIVELVNRRVGVDYYVARAGVLGWFGSVFYNDLMFNWLVGIVFFLVVFGGWYDNKDWKKVGLGLVLGLLGIGLGIWVG